MRMTRERLINAALFGTFLIATAARGTGPFKWDAAHYWAATQAMIGTLPAVPDGYWELRGIFTPFIYTPAAALTGLVGNQYAGYAVLLQNSVVLAVVAVFLLPAVVRIWKPVSTTMRVVGVALFWAVTSGFAAYPLVDLYPAFGILGLLILLRSQRWWVILAAGVVGGVAMNIRPAYLVVVVAVVVIVAIWKRWVGLLFPAGVVVALIPQSIMNSVGSGSWSPLPAGSDSLIALQSSYASFVVRYDTMIGDASARQFFCSPDMAQLIDNTPPQTGGELALAFLEHLPVSLVFSFEKVAASLAWHVGIPYSAAVRPIDVAYGIGITAITVIGIVALVFAVTRRVGAKRDGFGIAVLAAILVGSALTLVSSATETRFALILALLGVVGITVATGYRPIEIWRSGRWWIVAAVSATLIVYAVGAIGLGHPAPRGDVTTAICATS